MPAGREHHYRRPLDVQLNFNDRAAREQEFARARLVEAVGGKESPASLLLRTDKMAAAILLIAIFRGLHAEGLLFAEADGVEAIGRNAQRD
jgi:hypothetical protein